MRTFTHCLLTPFLALCWFVSATAQGIAPLREPINIGWFPKTVSYAPDESSIVVTACTDT